jgi:hypothetical protein
MLLPKNIKMTVEIKNLHVEEKVAQAQNIAQQD